ncbi:MAG: hypothetical protein AB7D33_07980 [Sphingobium sp.]
MFKSLLCCPCTDVEVDEEDGFYRVAIAIAERNGGNDIVTIECELAPYPLADFSEESVYEFSFSISYVALDGSSEPCVTQDRDLAKGYIPGLSRPFIMPSVCNALNALLDCVEPCIIYRVVKHPHLPEKAMQKHSAITHSLQNRGDETIKEGKDSFNRSFYVMQR